jgi:hypothetical protein
MMAMVGAGLLPGLAFVAEHHMTKRVRADMEAGVTERAFFLPRSTSRGDEEAVPEEAGD